MTDPLSVTASIIAVLQLTSVVVEYGLDFADAPESISKVKEEVQSLQLLLKQLKDRCENAQRQKTPPPWLQGLWEIRIARFGKEKYEYKGYVWQLTQNIEEAMAKLNPTKE